MQGEIRRRARILIVDDQEANVRLLESLLKQAGYVHLEGLTDPRRVEDVYAEFRPDLILLDLMMPHRDGFQVMHALQGLISPTTYLPILVLTADVTLPTRQKALAAGAKDFLVKPSDATEVLLRIENLLETRSLHLQLQDQNRTLEGKVAERTRQLEEAHIEVLERLALAAEYRDDDTGQHTRRVGATCAEVARILGLPDDLIEFLRRAAPLHDVGKIGIPDAILLKPGRLTPQEFEVVKAHTTIGARILSGGRFPLLQLAEEIAHDHHERWDGTGYPRGLAGKEIPIEARIVAVADAFDAMGNDRPYRRALSPDETWEVLWEGAGAQWDVEVVEALAAGRDAREKETDDHRHAEEPAGSLHR
ncbi:MAG: response regulator [Armatimonadota bacterium]|nr:response regulator [Armatimonadota bacterium]MDR7518597.1 response regulator [Armatimonadota bacterium]MDR7548464.1 response regulator [Armatimonadota bacterium]